MTITAQSPLVGPPSGTLGAALSYAGTDNAAYIREAWRLALTVGVDPAIVVSQSAHETNDWTSERWAGGNHNPAGLGIESDNDPDPATLTQTEAARLHVWALWFIASGPGKWTWQDGPSPFVLPASVAAFRRRWEAKAADANYPASVRTLADLQTRYVDRDGEPQAVWAWDDHYAAGIIARHRAMFGAEEEEQPVSIPETIDYAPLPVPVIVDLIGEDQPNQNPGIPMTPTMGTWHETANQAPGADALMHARYLRNGADGSQVSWHYTVDDTRIVQHLPLNRVGWHAGDGNGPGNYTTVAVECCVNRDGDLATAQRNTAALFGLLRARGIIGEVVQHNHWSGKDCPTQLRRGNTIPWARAQEMIAEYAATYSGAEPEPAEPVAGPIWWEPGDVGPVRRESDGAVALAMLGQVTAKRAVPVRTHASAKARIVTKLAQGATATIAGTYRAPNGQRWVFVETGDGRYGRALWSAFAERYPTL